MPRRLDAIETAARAAILGAFTAGNGCRADGAYSPRSWLIHKTRITKGAAAGHLAWARRAVTHPQVIAALAAGQMPSESYARTMRAMDAASALQQEWIEHVRALWAAARAAASVPGSDGAAWLDGDAARAVTCDAALTPVVTGEVDTSALDCLVHLCVQWS